MDYDLYTDEQIVNGILAGDRPLTEYFFHRKCSKLLAYILYSVFDGQQDCRALESELFLHIAHDDWHKLRQFEYRSSLLAYISVIAVRFFQRKRASLIDSPLGDALLEKHHQTMNTSFSVERRIDIEQALERMPNERYRKVIISLDLQEMRPEQLADEMCVTVDNLYNIHRRARLQLKLIMNRKEDYV